MAESNKKTILQEMTFVVRLRTNSTATDSDSDKMEVDQTAEELNASENNTSDPIGELSCSLNKSVLIDSDEEVNDATSAESKAIELPRKSIFDFDCIKNPEPWPFDKYPSKPAFYPRLCRMLLTHKNPSVAILIGSYKFSAHKVLLRCHSKYFEEHAKELSIRLPEEEVAPAAFYYIYYLMLLGKRPLTRNGIVELYKAACFLAVDELIEQCFHLFNNVKVFNEMTAFSLYSEATRFRVKALPQLMLSRISKCFLSIAATSDFMQLNFVQIMEFLKMSNLGVNNEIEIFYCCLRWLRHDWDLREKFMVDLVFGCVRFKLLPPVFLRFLQLPAKTRILHHITTNELIKTKILEAFMHHLSNDGTTTKPEIVNSQEDRAWILDESCNYHHDIKCPRHQFVTYSEFNAYFLQLQNSEPDSWTKIKYLKDMPKPINCCNGKISHFSFKSVNE